MKSGDVVLKINNDVIKSTADLPKMIANTRPGTQIMAQIWRW